MNIIINILAIIGLCVITVLICELLQDFYYFLIKNKTFRPILSWWTYMQLKLKPETKEDIIRLWAGGYINEKQRDKLLNKK